MRTLDQTLRDLGYGHRPHTSGKRVIYVRVRLRTEDFGELPDWAPEEVEEEVGTFSAGEAWERLRAAGQLEGQ